MGPAQCRFMHLCDATFGCATFKVEHSMSTIVCRPLAFARWPLLLLYTRGRITLLPLLLLYTPDKKEKIALWCVQHHVCLNVRRPRGGEGRPQGTNLDIL